MADAESGYRPRSRIGWLERPYQAVALRSLDAVDEPDELAFGVDVRAERGHREVRGAGRGRQNLTNVGSHAAQD